MAEFSRFHAAVAYSDTLFAETFSTVHLDGVDGSTLNSLAVTATTGLTVSIDTGIAWMQGRWYQNSAALTLTADAADGSYPRYDRIVLRWTTGSPGTINLAILKGTAAASPVLPALTQTSSVWEIPISTLNITAGLATIIAANIIDARRNLSSGSLGYVIDGGGSAITTGSKGYMQVPFSCVLIGWTLIGNADDSMVVDVKSAVIAAWPADSITTASIAASDKPTLSGKQIARGICTGWTAAVAEGTILEFVVDSCATTSRATVQLHFVRTN
jgi:hypothetical protein